MEHTDEPPHYAPYARITHKYDIEESLPRLRVGNLVFPYTFGEAERNTTPLPNRESKSEPPKCVS